MSFSLEIKNEICRLSGLKPCCILSECYGLLLTATVFSHNEIRFTIENEIIANRICMLISMSCGIDLSIYKTGKKHIIKIEDKYQLKRILNAVGYDYKQHIIYHLNRNIIDNDCCTASFLRGMFLTSGSVASPDKKCHLEIKTVHKTLCREVLSLMLDIGMSPKFVERQTSAILYFKDTGRIEDFLTTIGAPISAMSIMEAKVEKQIRGQVNRQVNCETANISKSADASARQIRAIESVLKKHGEDGFPDNMKETVKLRIENPDLSLSELAELFEPKISKPGLSHRLKKIVEFAEKMN